MNSKVMIGGDQSGVAAKCKAEEARADTAVRELRKVKDRIRAFYSEVDYVSFEDTDTAPVWASEWFDYLLDGKVPAPVVEDDADVVAASEVAMTDEFVADEAANDDVADYPDPNEVTEYVEPQGAPDVGDAPVGDDTPVA